MHFSRIEILKRIQPKTQVLYYDPLLSSLKDYFNRERDKNSFFYEQFFPSFRFFVQDRYVFSSCVHSLCGSFMLRSTDQFVLPSFFESLPKLGTALDIYRMYLLRMCSDILILGYQGLSEYPARDIRKYKGILFPKCNKFPLVSVFVKNSVIDFSLPFFKHNPSLIVTSKDAQDKVFQNAPASFILWDKKSPLKSLMQHQGCVLENHNIEEQFLSLLSQQGIYHFNIESPTLTQQWMKLHLVDELYWTQYLIYQGHPFSLVSNIFDQPVKLKLLEMVSYQNEFFYNRYQIY